MPNQTKTRAIIYQVALFDFQPFNGFEVEIPTALLQRYNAAMNALSDARDELINIINPQAAASDAAIEAHRKRNGLQLLPPTKDPSDV